jgi:hypothetical protein
MTNDFQGAGHDALFLFQPPGLSRLPAALRPRHRRATILVRSAALLNRATRSDPTKYNRHDPSSGAAQQSEQDESWRYRVMARKLRVYHTALGVFDQAVAAPSMKAALEARGSNSNLFHQGGARETVDPEIVAAKPGVVLRRAVGSSGPFTYRPAHGPGWREC